MVETKIKKILSLILCAVLIAAAVLVISGCGTEKKVPTDLSGEEKTVLGTGSVSFFVDVFNKEGERSSFEVKSDKKILLDALLEVNLIEGEQQTVGFMVEKVNGERCVWSEDGMYWAVYTDGDYSMVGVDSIEIKAETVYTFRAQSE